MKPHTTIGFSESRSDVASANLTQIGERAVVCLRISGGKHHGAITESASDTSVRAVETAARIGVPFVGILDTSGADITEGVAALHAWGCIAKALSEASGVVPTVLIVTGACVSGPALLLGIADIVIFTSEAFAYVSDPSAVRDFTGLEVSRADLGGVATQERSGVASFVVADESAALELVEHIFDYIPANHLEDPPYLASDDPMDRPCNEAVQIVPQQPNAAYDIRLLIQDVMDDGSLLEVRSHYAPNIVTAFAHLGGNPVGIVANQPMSRAGTIDIEASQKAARFVQTCDAFNISIVTFVDTPGFEPGKDLEWRGMIRYGAELVHAYAAASVPRLSVVIRKAYGGAYIVMDSKGLGNDWSAAWPKAEIAVMGSAGAVKILYGKKLAKITNDAERERQLNNSTAEYEEQFSNPRQAAELGYVDMVIQPVDTRSSLATALAHLSTKREDAVARKHSNTPL